MVAEETSEPPRGELPYTSERDLLAERRARRAAESVDPALARRAEAAEATVQALETHLANLQLRLREAEEEGRRSIERLTERENELRRVKQQEYAEQQLRVEAERALAAERADGRTEIVQRLQERVAVLEHRAEQLAQEIDAERRARERTERELDAMRESHATMAQTVHDLKDVAGKLRAAAERRLPNSLITPVAAPASRARGEEMAAALAAAVERLQARAQATAPAEPDSPPPPPARQQAIAAAPVAKSHKHSMSLIGRWRYARKHRREDR